MNYKIFYNGNEIEPAGISQIYSGSTLIWEKKKKPAFYIERVGKIDAVVVLTAGGILAPLYLTEDGKFYDLELNALTFDMSAVSKPRVSLTYYTQDKVDEWGEVTEWGKHSYDQWNPQLIIGDRLIYSPGVNYNTIIRADASLNFTAEAFRDSGSTFINDGRASGVNSEGIVYAKERTPEFYTFSGDNYLYHTFPFKEGTYGGPDEDYNAEGDKTYSVSYQNGKSIVMSSELFLLGISKDGTKKVFAKDNSSIVLQNGSGGFIHLCDLTNSFNVKNARVRIANDIILIAHDRELLLFNSSTGAEIQPKFLKGTVSIYTFKSALAYETEKYDIITELVYGGGYYLFMIGNEYRNTFLFYSKDGETWTGEIPTTYKGATDGEGGELPVPSTGGVLKRATDADIVSLNYSPGLGSLVYNDGFYLLGNNDDGNEPSALYKIHF